MQLQSNVGTNPTGAPRPWNPVDNAPRWSIINRQTNWSREGLVLWGDKGNGNEVFASAIGRTL